MKIIKATKESEELRKTCRALLNAMMHSGSEDSFNKAYADFKSFLLATYCKFLNYFDKQWLVKKELWCKAWRQVKYTRLNICRLYQRLMTNWTF